MWSCASRVGRQIRPCEPQWRTTGPASRRSTCRGCSIASTAPTVQSFASTSAPAGFDEGDDVFFDVAAGPGGPGVPLPPFPPGGGAVRIEKGFVGGPFASPEMLNAELTAAKGDRDAAASKGD